MNFYAGRTNRSGYDHLAAFFDDKLPGFQVVDCAELLISCHDVHSKQCAVRVFGLLLRNPLSMSRSPLLADANGVGAGALVGRVGARSAGGVVGPNATLPAGRADGGTKAGTSFAPPATTDGVMAKYSLHLRQKVDFAISGSCCCALQCGQRTVIF